MPAYLTEEHVDRTADRVDALPPHQQSALERRVTKLQPEVFGFVFDFTSELRPEVAALTDYLITVLVEMFATSGARRMIKVRESTILRHWHANVAQSAAFLSGDEAPRSLRDATEEPAALDYITDIVFEDPGLEDSLNLTPTEAMTATLILKTAVDAMHDACRS